MITEDNTIADYSEHTSLKFSSGWLLLCIKPTDRSIDHTFVTTHAVCSYVHNPSSPWSIKLASYIAQSCMNAVHICIACIALHLCGFGVLNVCKPNSTQYN